MKSKKKKSIARPSVSEIEQEIIRLDDKQRRNRNIKYILSISAVVVALIIIITNVWFPVLRVVGTSMNQNISNGDIIVCFNSHKNIKTGDIIAFYNNGNILLKRVVGVSGDVIEMDESGGLIVNGKYVDEPYVISRSYEPCDIEFPVEVEEDSFFVLGDQRNTSMDSRTEAVGLVKKDSIIGKVLIRVWPIDNIDIIQ